MIRIGECGMGKIKRMTAGALACAVSFCTFMTSVNAEVLGSVSSQWATDMGGGAVYHHIEYTSDSVGKQTENFVEYTPNTDSVPIVVNGASVYGKRNMTSVVEYMESNNLRPLIGINADFFSVKTGIPMGYTIIDGEIYSKDAGLTDGIGFRSDGTAFIDKIGITSTLSYGGKTIEVQYINKWSQDDFGWVYMLTDDFGDTTKTNYNALYAVCTPISGSLALNTEMQLRVDEVYIYDGEIAIPDGKYVFVMDPEGYSDCVDLIANLAPGNVVTFRNSVYGAERYDWTQAAYGLSCSAGRLINNGIIGSGFEAGAAPRTAVGVKADGTVVFYTIDGRQENYSYGVQNTTLAKRMQELGCIDALNLDGGGSTTIGGWFPGTDSFMITNRPSDGAERSVANFLFLRDMREATGIPWYIEWRDYSNRNYMAGSSVQLEATKVYDSANYPMYGLENMNYSVDNTGNAQTTVDENGLITFKGDGVSYVTAYNDYYTHTWDFATYETPDDIKIYDEATGEEVYSFTIHDGEMYNVDLEAAAFVNGIQLEGYPSLFKWEVVGDVGTVNEDGQLALKDNETAFGALRVTVGNCVKEFPINVLEPSRFADMTGHWAYDIVESMADTGIITGYESDGQLIFSPDTNITREQFAAVMCKSLDIDMSEYEDTELDFTDAQDIQPWAVDYVKAMVSLGYISGNSDDNGATYYFAPSSNITRAQAFTIMSRVMIGENAFTEPAYSDSWEIPVWAYSAVGRLSALGIIKGYNDNSILPNNPLTRAEALSLVSKMMDLDE